MSFDSLEEVFRRYATPVVTLRQRLNQEGIFLTIAWGPCVFTSDVTQICRKEIVSIADVERQVRIAISGLALAIKDGTCSECGARKDREACASCGACGHS